MKTPAPVRGLHPRGRPPEQDVSTRIDAVIARLSPEERMPLEGAALEILRRERWRLRKTWDRRTRTR